MTIQAATPYLILNGRAERALALYERALGARTEIVQRFGEVHGSCPEAQRDLIMHAALLIGETKIMLSDGPGTGDLPPTGIVSIALHLDDVEQAHRSFDALAQNGSVVEPLFDAPWGALFGVVRDELGVSWMFNCEKK
jgi:PhnB protein